MKFLVTGGAGFIGSALIGHLIRDRGYPVLNIDSLTYAGNLASLKSVCDSELYSFRRVDICDRNALKDAFRSYRPDVVMNLAAESHVDRSIDGPDVFLKTNVFGTYTLLQVAREYWQELPTEQRSHFRFHHVSTDEVYGDLEANAEPFTEEMRYVPSSPYSASKAASDHLVHAWHRTYGLPTLITNCSNNYGPHHFPEKLIPHMILNAMQGAPLPVYGDGRQIRDWLYVEDHARALALVAEQGTPGENYNIGGNSERMNIEVVKAICAILDEIAPATLKRGLSSFGELITFVKDRPGHDRRYAINAQKIKNELGWVPMETFETGLRKTVAWYLDNEEWWGPLLDGKYRLARLGGVA